MKHKLDYKKQMHEAITKLRHILNVAEAEINASEHEHEVHGTIFFVSSLAYTVLEVESDIESVMKRMLHKDVTPEEYRC